jgi:hypothetical protein
VKYAMCIQLSITSRIVFVLWQFHIHRHRPISTHEKTHSVEYNLHTLVVRNKLNVKQFKVNNGSVLRIYRCSYCCLITVTQENIYAPGNLTTAGVPN